MKKQVKGQDGCGVVGRVLLKLVDQDHAFGPGWGCAVAAQCWLIPGFPGLAGPTVPFKTLRPGRGGEAEESKDG